VVLQQLRYLDALARERHFGRAAEACHVSQPALSSGIRKLEEELGLVLVQRGHRFDGLTTEGNELLRWARSALASVEGLTAEASRLRGGLSGTIRIGLIPTVSARLGSVLGAFLAAQPGVGLEITTSTTTRITERILTHELDAGLFYVDDPPGRALHTQPLYRERLMLLTSEAVGTGPDEPVRWADAAKLPLCLLVPTMQNRQLIDAALRQAGVTAHVRVEADSVVALVELGEAGCSCVVADSWLADRPRPAGVHAHPLVSPTVTPTIGLVTATGPLVSPTVAALRASLAATAARDSAAAFR